MDPKHLQTSFNEIQRQLEAESKKSPTSTTLFNVLGGCQRRPFCTTPFGTLSSEIRAMIYRYLFVACPQPQTWIEATFCSRKIVVRISRTASALHCHLPNEKQIRISLVQKLPMEHLSSNLLRPALFIYVLQVCLYYGYANS